MNSALYEVASAAFHVMTLVPVFLILIGLFRFWRFVYQIGFLREVIRRARNMVALDAVTVGLSVLTGYYAAMHWWGFSLPILGGVLPDWQTDLFAVGSVAGCVGMARVNSWGRFDGPVSVAGMMESSLHTLAYLDILNAAELAHALELLQKHSARQKAAREVNQ